ncbi:MAG: lipoyl domain-containing protein [Anaerolineae bacterium]|nr:lipoyl domain-containing protein [Anaerolineae bacterium]MDW8172367.1 lipoyl domain-containing protein [Anaerolineae bacterium]
MATKVVVPPLGDSSDEVTIVQWHKQEGDAIERGTILLDIETDKAQIEVEAYGSGILRKIFVPAGRQAQVGALLAIIAAPDEDISGLLE